MKYALVLLLGFTLLAGNVPARAEEESKPPKEMVNDLSRAAHDALIKVKNPEGQTVVKAEDAKKLVYPLISYNEREMAVARGHLSAYAKWCGLEWGKDYFTPYMRSLEIEHKKNWTPFQYAYAEVLHGVSMGYATQQLKGKTCNAAEKARIAALAKK